MDEVYKQKFSAPVHSTLLYDFEYLDTASKLICNPSEFSFLVFYYPKVLSDFPLKFASFRSTFQLFSACLLGVVNV